MDARRNREQRRHRARVEREPADGDHREPKRRTLRRSRPGKRVGLVQQLVDDRAGGRTDRRRRNDGQSGEIVQQHEHDEVTGRAEGADDGECGKLKQEHLRVACKGEPLA